MIQRNKKDYLQRLIEEFFARFNHLVDGSADLSIEDKKVMLDDCFLYFFSNFDVVNTDTIEQIAEKLNNNDLLEQYAKLLYYKDDLCGGDKNSLIDALTIVEHLGRVDKVFSWERTVLREDILRVLESRD